jgi:hypothetical protein
LIPTCRTGIIPLEKHTYLDFVLRRSENLTFKRPFGERLSDENGLRPLEVGPAAPNKVMYSEYGPRDGLFVTLTCDDVRSFWWLPTNGVRLISLHQKDIGERDL